MSCGAVLVCEHERVPPNGELLSFKIMNRISNLSTREANWEHIVVISLDRQRIYKI